MNMHNTSDTGSEPAAHRQTITWEWRTFSQLSTDDLYRLLRLRQQVFVVEQNCPYLDADGLDQGALHLLCRQSSETGPQLVGYLRILAPGSKYRSPAIGRLVTAPSVRGKGLARQMMKRALRQVGELYPGRPVAISAQQYLESFYTSLGFMTTSPPYDEDGIPHLDMLFSSHLPAPDAAVPSMPSSPAGGSGQQEAISPDGDLPVP